MGSDSHFKGSKTSWDPSSSHQVTCIFLNGQNSKFEGDNFLNK